MSSFLPLPAMPTGSSTHDQARDLAHEIRNRLGAISGRVEMAMVNGRLDARPETVLSTIDDTIRRTVVLVEQLAALTDVTDGGRRHVTPASEVVDLATLARDVAHDMEATQALGSQRVVVGSRGRVVVEARRADIRRVIENLVGNALKYSPADRSVGVLVRAHPGIVSLRVSDRGVGIAPEDLPRIYEAGFRSQRLEVRSTAGTGQGLAITRRIVEHHGGDITTTSRLGRGTEVTVLLPGPSPSSAPTARPDR